MRDVVVIGGGPAGAWAAYALARAGARVCLVDGTHPREKPCGGGVTGRALRLVAGAVPSDQFPSVRIERARFVDTRSARSASVPLVASSSGEPPLVVASRAAFDAALMTAAQTAGAEWIRTRATNVTPRRDGGFRVDTADRGPLCARLLIGADGANSLVRRRLLRPFRRDQLSIATGFFAHGATSDEIVIELVDDPPGYIWSFPRPDHLAIGICAQADSGAQAGALRERVRRWSRDTGVGHGARFEPYAWPIPSLGARDLLDQTPCGRDWFLIGDAAGLVDPITREGIFFALLSAECAADAITHDGRTYAARLRAHVSAELARAAHYKAGFFRPRFSRLMVEALTSSAGIRRVVADLVAGTQPYRGLKWRLAKTFEVRLAVKAFSALR